MPRPIQASREVTLSSDREAPFDVIARCTLAGIKGDIKQHRQHPPGIVTTTSHDDGRN
jgi:hypothetical protein